MVSLLDFPPVISDSIETLPIRLETVTFEILEDSSLRLRSYHAAKRALDILGASVALILSSPLLAVLALLIKLTDFGPALFQQSRVGLHGKIFRCYKLRSMVLDAELLKESLAGNNRHDDHRTFKIINDPRITWIGRFLRRTSLDELPQLWNVLMGDMSIVGPRPPVPDEVARYSAVDFRRLEVKPGLTCIWQVSGRSEVPFAQQVQLDIAYIERRSFWFDLKLILWTIPAVLSGRGAY